MNGFERLKKQIEGQKDPALQEVVKYLLSRTYMEPKYLNEEKSIAEMCKFIKKKGLEHVKNGWSFIENEVVFSWAITYWSFPNSYLKINSAPQKQEGKKNEEKSKNNIISLEKGKKELETKKEIEQLTLF